MDLFTKEEQKASFPKFEIHRKDFPDMFNLILWGGMPEPQDTLEEFPNVKVCTPGNSCIHEFNKFDVKPKSMSLLTFKRQEVTLETIPLQAARPFIYRLLTTNHLEECLRKNSSAKNINNILEKEVMYLIQEFYEGCNRTLIQTKTLEKN